MSLPDVTIDQDGPADLVAQGRRALRRQLPWLLVLVLVCGAAAGGLTRLRPTTYISTVQFVVQSASGAGDTETLIRTMQALVDSEIIGADLATTTDSTLSPEQVVDRLTVQRPPGAGVLAVEVADSDAARGRRLAEQLIPVFERRVNELSEPQPGVPTTTYSIRPWGSGTVRATIRSAPVVRNTVLGLLLGALVGLVAVTVRAASRPVLLTPEQAASAFRLPMIGALPRSRRHGPDPLDALSVLLRGSRSPDWPAAPRRVLVLGGSDAVDRGKLLVDAACALQPRGDAVLVDANGGPGSLTRLFRVKSRPGLVDALDGDRPLHELLVPLAQGRLPAADPGDVQGSGAGGRRATARGRRLHRRPDGAREPGLALGLLPYGRGSLTMSQAGALAGLVGELGQEGIVLIDAMTLSGPMSWGPLLKQVDAVLVLAVLGKTRAEQARTTGDSLLALSDRPVGVLLLDADRLLLPGATANDLRPPSSATPGEKILAGRVAQG